MMLILVEILAEKRSSKPEQDREEALEQTRARWNTLKPVRESWSKPKLEQASWVELVAFSIWASDAVAWT